MAYKFGSVCSGIDAASVAFNRIGMGAAWFSEIADFPSSVLKHHYPQVTNIGDMMLLPDLIRNESIMSPDVLCGGTPCNSFSLAGLRGGLSDSRGNLTMGFIQIADAIDDMREQNGRQPSVILWENVEGVLSDKSNAFGQFIQGLAGSEEAINVRKWGSAGVAVGKRRQVIWRTFDAKYFGVPQQRKRVFVVATARNECASEILLESKGEGWDYKTLYKKRDNNECAIKDVHGNVNTFNIFRSYTDCLYAAYGTKWNGNAASFNGSLFVAHNSKIRRLTPLECERLMGFPDNYTNIIGASDTARYKALGNSWAVPVVAHIGKKYIELHEQQPNKRCNRPTGS